MSIFEVEIVWVSGLWERRDYPTIMSGWVVRYTAHHGKPGEMEISASREAVCIDGVRFTGAADSADVLDILHRALRQHLNLKRSDRNDPLPEEGRRPVPEQPLEEVIKSV